MPARRWIALLCLALLLFAAAMPGSAAALGYGILMALPFAVACRACRRLPRVCLDCHALLPGFRPVGGGRAPPR